MQICLCTTFVPGALSSKEGTTSPGAGVTAVSCHVGARIEPGPVKEQPVVLAAEPSPTPIFVYQLKAPEGGSQYLLEHVKEQTGKEFCHCALTVFPQRVWLHEYCPFLTSNPLGI